MIDSLKEYIKKTNRTEILKKFKLSPHKYLLITIHRPSNVDSFKQLKRVINIIKSISEKYDSFKLVFPLHPRTREKLREFNLDKKIKTINNILLLPPLGYKKFIALMSKSLAVITDSGGIQEETTFLKVPCITLRNSTERPVTVSMGTNKLCDLDEKTIISNIESIIKGNFKKGLTPYRWDGKTSQRILKILEKEILINVS